MRMSIIGAVFALAACTAVQPADPAVTARIVKACTASGFFKLVNGAVALAVPAADIPIALVDAGIDQVCMHPETVAVDVSTVERLLKRTPK